MRLALLIFGGSLLCSAEDRLAMVRADLRQLAVDRTQTYRVRELELSEAGAKFYLSEGVLAFATPVAGNRVAALFTTSQVEAGDAEVIALPPIPAERASLARFAKAPNLDEHFTSALLFFSNTTADELLRQIHQHPVHAAPELAADLGSRFDKNLRDSAAEIEVRIAQSVLDRHAAANGFFYGIVSGRTLGAIDFIYQPKEPDTLVFGHVDKRAPDNHATQDSYFQIWSAFRPANFKELAPAYQIGDYHIDTTIHPDLSLTSIASFDYQADAEDGAVISLLLSPRLRVTSASIDGSPAGVLMHDSPRDADIHGAMGFLLASEKELKPGTHHQVQIEYTGTVIRRTPNGSYFVDDRNAWYPLKFPMLTVFDLTFRCPANLRLVSTGDPVSEELVAGGQRSVHRRTSHRQALAGFNLGDFKIIESEHPPYRIQICSNPQDTLIPDLDQQAAQILKYFSDRWMPLSNRSLSVAPIEGYFGQGFPGLIYLSNISYLQAKDRPSSLRNAAFDSFFSSLLLPHELAHQWWGNIVTPGDYRSNWIVEAMSNYSALQYLEQVNGPPAMDRILADYRADLTKTRAQGELVDSYGPVTFDQRLENNFGPGIWHDIIYEKGTWIFHLLRQRMGDAQFKDFQLQLLKDFAAKPISNDDLRTVASRYIPANQPDKHLNSFFETWVYNTGIPTLSIKGRTLELHNVPDNYVLDVPLSCLDGSTKWLELESGEAEMPDRKCSLPPVTSFLYKNQ